VRDTLQHAATHCYVHVLHTAPRCNTLQHIVTFICCTLQHAATRYIILSLSYVAHWNTLEHIVIFICCTLQHTAPHWCVDMRDATRAFVRDDSIILVTWLMHMFYSNASCCAHECVMPHITHTNASMYVLAFVRIRICMYICVCICNECVMPHITHTNASCHLCNLAFLPVLP